MSHNIGFSPKGALRLDRIRPSSGGSAFHSVSQSSSLFHDRRNKCRIAKRRKNSIDIRPPANIPMARKARTSAGEPPAEKNPPEEPLCCVGLGLGELLVVGAIVVDIAACALQGRREERLVDPQ